MADKITYAIYDDEETLLKSAKHLVHQGTKVADVFSPFPIHGLEEAIGIKRTRMAVVSFLFGISGTAITILGLWYFMIEDWPMNIGGKPSFALYKNIASFIPPIFEITVLCAAHGMALTFLLRNKTLPGLSPRNPDPRTTDDKFAIKILASQNPDLPEDELQKALRDTGAEEIDERTV